MTDIDTSPEAVGRLSVRLEGTPLYEGHGEESETPELSAATLRALSARLTDAEDEIKYLAKACSEWAVTSQRNYQRAKAAEAERDKLRALTPAAMLVLHEKFMSGAALISEEKAAADALHRAAAFGSAAFMGAIDADQGTAAMMRSILLALVDPMHPDLDYLRADPEAVRKARAALAGGAKHD